MEHIVVERSEWTRHPHIVAHCVWPVEILDSSVLLGVIRIVPCDLAASLQVTSPLEASKENHAPDLHCTAIICNLVTTLQCNCEREHMHVKL
jgi:hypothetical protein